MRRSCNVDRQSDSAHRAANTDRTYPSSTVLRGKARYRILEIAAAPCSLAPNMRATPTSMRDSYSGPCALGLWGFPFPFISVILDSWILKKPLPYLSALAQPTRLEAFRLLVITRTGRPARRRCGAPARRATEHLIDTSGHSHRCRPGALRAQRPLDHLPRRSRPLSRTDPVPAQGLLQWQSGGVHAAVAELVPCCEPVAESQNAERRRTAAAWLHSSQHTPTTGVPCPTAYSMSCFCAPATPRARSWPKASWPRTAPAASAPSPRAACRSPESIRSRWKPSAVSATRREGMRSKSWDEFDDAACAGHGFHFHRLRQRGR